mgnify:CR=1 FL=1
MPDRPLRTVTRASSTVIRAISQRDNAILEALGGGADGAPRDGNVTVYELKAFLNDQVPELSREHKGSTQWPYTFSIGHDFPLIRSKNPPPLNP